MGRGVLTVRTETFIQRLPELDLRLEVRVSDGQKRLVLSGDQTKVSNNIRKYIREHREVLIEVLQSKNTDDQAEETALDASPIANEATNLETVAIGDIRLLPCYLSTYGLCENRVVEQDETTWRMSPDGLLFCVSCWQARNIEQADLAIPYLADHGQPTDLETRIERIMSGPGYGCCGGHDWVVDWTGILVCHHVIEGAQRLESEEVATRRSPAQAA